MKKGQQEGRSSQGVSTSQGVAPMIRLSQDSLEISRKNSILGAHFSGEGDTNYICQEVTYTMIGTPRFNALINKLNQIDICGIAECDIEYDSIPKFRDYTVVTQAAYGIQRVCTLMKSDIAYQLLELDSPALSFTIKNISHSKFHLQSILNKRPKNKTKFEAIKTLLYF